MDKNLITNNLFYQLYNPELCLTYLQSFQYLNQKDAVYFLFYLS
jgi:hypothetical protein